MGFANTFITVKLLLVIFTDVQSSATLNLQPLNPQRDAILRRFNYFDLELLKEFSESLGNIFVSPASIKTTLALILEGAKGTTAREIGNALRIENIEDRETREILERLLFDLNDSTANTALKSASSVFVSNKYDVLPEFSKKVRKYYRGAVTPVDYTNPIVAAKEINSWAANATGGLIGEIASDPDPETAVVLANALYFKGQWKTAFNPDDTKERCFASPTRGCVITRMMQLSSTFNYNFNIDLNAHAIELPYQDDRYSMLILLPTNGNNVRTLARDMQHAQLHMILDALKPIELTLEIPKFEIDYQIDLVEFLKPLKIQEIFGSKANLSGMMVQDGVKINNIIHKTKVEVNEQGTKAAAVTTAVVIPLMGSMRIEANHPFIFFIYNRESRNIIFEGLFAEPGSPKPAPTANEYQIPKREGPAYPRYDAQRSKIGFY